MKAKNRAKKLRDRIADWESMRSTGMIGNNVKLINKSAFRKPGSNIK